MGTVKFPLFSYLCMEKKNMINKKVWRDKKYGSISRLDRVRLETFNLYLLEHATAFRVVLKDYDTRAALEGYVEGMWGEFIGVQCPVPIFAARDRQWVEPGKRVMYFNYCLKLGKRVLQQVATRWDQSEFYKRTEQALPKDYRLVFGKSGIPHVVKK